MLLKDSVRMRILKDLSIVFGKLLFVLLGIIACVVLGYASFVFKRHAAFYGNIAGDLCLQQRFYTSDYDLVQCSSGKLLVEKPFDWMVDGNFLYGTTGKSPEYFIVSLDGSSNKSHIKSSLTDFNNSLEMQRLRPYDMSESENPVHLIFGNGRNRVFNKKKE